jgi:LytS/YehU family sensor histidine kinase
MMPRIPGPPPDLPTLLFLLGVGSVTWYVALLALPLLLWGARRFIAEGDSRWRTFGLAAAAAVALFAIASIDQYAASYSNTALGPPIIAYLTVAIRQNLLPFVALVGIVAAIESRRRAGDAALERERLRTLVAEQQLVALTTQLQPHFLFNTLQSISTLLHRDAHAADEMLTKLSELLRELLRHREHPLVSLREELHLSTLFLDIAQVRFADRLGFVIDVPTELQDARLPLFLLQPLVENALTHGIGRRAAGGQVRIEARRDDDHLVISVIDDGAGLSDTARADGIGLGNTRARLLAAFGDAQTFALVPRSGGGTEARVTIPLRRGA